MRALSRYRSNEASGIRAERGEKGLARALVEACCAEEEIDEEGVLDECDALVLR